MIRRSPLRTRLVSLGYGVFYRLPQRWRVRLTRLITPTYVLGAVVLIYDSDAGSGGSIGGRGTGDRLLLLRQPPGRGWTLPAGLLGRHEPPELGACREVAEETGIVLTPDQLTPAVPNAMVHAHGHWVDIVFTARVPAASTELEVDGAEVWEARWHPVTELPPLTAATARLLRHYGVETNSSQAATDQ